MVTVQGVVRTGVTITGHCVHSGVDPTIQDFVPSIGVGILKFLSLRVL